MSAKTDVEAKDMYYEALEVRQGPDSSQAVAHSPPALARAPGCGEGGALPTPLPTMVSWPEEQDHLIPCWLLCTPSSCLFSNTLKLRLC